VRAGTDRAVGPERVLVDALPRAAIAPDRFGRPIERVDGLAEQGDGLRREASEPDAAVQSGWTLITMMEASALGVPQQRFPSFVTVVLQLWDGDPPEVREAARRLRDAGRSRDRVLDRLGEPVLLSHLRVGVLFVSVPVSFVSVCGSPLAAK
jgi:hypothetical protein